VPVGRHLGGTHVCVGLVRIVVSYTQPGGHSGAHGGVEQPSLRAVGLAGAAVSAADAAAARVASRRMALVRESIVRRLQRVVRWACYMARGHSAPRSHRREESHSSVEWRAEVGPRRHVEPVRWTRAGGEEEDPIGPGLGSGLRFGMRVRAKRHAPVPWERMGRKAGEGDDDAPGMVHPYWCSQWPSRE